jgi:hypothetical protein
MRVVAVLLVLLVAAVGGNAAHAACLDARDPLLSSYRYPTLQEEANEALAIVVGTVVRAQGVAEAADPEVLDEYIYTIEVKESLKGHLPKRFDVRVSNTSGGYRMSDGETHLLFVDRLWGELGIDPCGNSAQLKDAGATIERLRSGSIVDPPMSEDEGAEHEESVQAPGFRTVHGRLRYFNGNPTARIWIVGTRFMLGVRDGGEGVYIPKELSDLMNLDRDIYADFEVQPLTPFRPGVMRIVMIRSASNIVVTEGGKIILMKDRL